MSAARLPEYELELRVVEECPNWRYAVRVDGVLNLVYRYYRPGVLWLIPLDEKRLYYYGPEEMDGYDTECYPVAEYRGPLRNAIRRPGKLIDAAWSPATPFWTTDELFDDERERGVEKRQSGEDRESFVRG